nr:pro-neuregulin-3, membrane-bound isoform-like [Columba livia]
MRILIVEELLQMPWLRLTLQFEHERRAVCGTCYTTTYSTERSEHFKPCKDKDLAYCLNEGECFVIETLTGSHKHCRFSVPHQCAKPIG